MAWLAWWLCWVDCVAHSFMVVALGAWRLLGWLGVAVVGWCRLGCGEGYGAWGVCGKAGVGFVLFWRSLFCVSSGNSAALAPRPAPVLHTGARVRGRAFRFASAAVSWMQNRLCSFLAFPFLRFVGEQCGACAAAGTRAPHGRAGARARVSFRIGGGLMDAKPAEGMGGVVRDA